MSEARDVSVVICTRDGRSKGFVDAALRSVLDQSSPAAEIIVVDDASTDGTPSYVKDTYPHVRVEVNRGSGLAAARNTGIALARGRWVAFIDDDDVWRPGKLAHQLAQIGGSSRPESTIWASRMVSIDVKGRVAWRPVRLDHVARWPACLLGCPVTPSGAIMAKSLLDRFGGFSEHLSDGSAFDYWARCLSAGVQIVFSDDVLLEHRQHARQMTRPERKMETVLAGDAIVIPYLERLAPAQARRVRTARVLLHWRWFLMHEGSRGAARYWRDTPLRQERMGWRGTLYPLLDLAAAGLPWRLRARLRDLASRTVA
jgi:glycosyltransferase involved in cell wall biosynthesis